MFNGAPSDSQASDSQAPVSQAPVSPPSVAEPPVADGRAPHAAILLALFLLVAIGLTFPNVSRLRTYIPGDSGDSLLNLWIIRRVQIGLPHGWHALWDPPIFYPARATLAYSDTLIPVALVDWPLRLMLGDVLALNAISLGSWVLSSWCVYRLAARFVRHWGAAVVGALAYTYAATRLVHQQHFQLVVGGALVPLVVLLLLRLFDQPTLALGVLLGLGIVGVALTASYFGALMAVVVVIIAAGLLFARRHRGIRPCVSALAAAAAVVIVLVAPVGLKYAQLQRHPEFRRSFQSTTAADFSDFTATAAHNYMLDHVPVVPTESRANRRGIENRLFPGFVALGFGAVGLLVVGAGLRKRARRDDRTVELALLAVAGAVGVVLAFGDWIRIGGHRVYLPFALLRHLPGFAGIRAVARLELAFQLALALLAAVGIDTVLRRFPARARAVGTLALAALVVAECAISLVFVKVPTSADDGGVDTALRARPAGVVLELPINSANRGLPWADAEAPRQLLALRDHDPRVNGYSGFQPKGFDLQAAVLDHFPQSDALGLAHRLGVRYVVLRTRLVGALSPASAVVAVDKDGAGRYDEQTAARIVAALPAGTATTVTRLAGGYLVELAP